MRYYYGITSKVFVFCAKEFLPQSPQRRHKELKEEQKTDMT